MAKTRTIQVRMDDDDITKLDELRREVSSFQPNRSAMIRALIRQAHTAKFGEDDQ
jgi:ribbon-helix-helix CopG family protein